MTNHQDPTAGTATATAAANSDAVTETILPPPPSRLFPCPPTDDAARTNMTMAQKEALARLSLHVQARLGQFYDKLCGIVNGLKDIALHQNHVRKLIAEYEAKYEPYLEWARSNTATATTTTTKGTSSSSTTALATASPAPGPTSAIGAPSLPPANIPAFNVHMASYEIESAMLQERQMKSAFHALERRARDLELFLYGPDRPSRLDPNNPFATVPSEVGAPSTSSAGATAAAPARRTSFAPAWEDRAGAQAARDLAFVQDMRDWTKRELEAVGRGVGRVGLWARAPAARRVREELGWTEAQHASGRVREVEVQMLAAVGGPREIWPSGREARNVLGDVGIDAGPAVLMGMMD